MVDDNGVPTDDVQGRPERLLVRLVPERLVPMERRPNDRVDLLGLYVEEVWCSTIGARGVILARQSARLLNAKPTGADLDVADLAARMGVTPARVLATLDRLVGWGVVTRLHDAVGVSGYAPLVPPARLARLPASVVAAHHLILNL